MTQELTTAELSQKAAEKPEPKELVEIRPEDIKQEDEVIDLKEEAVVADAEEKKIQSETEELSEDVSSEEELEKE